jgi:hypothetical protein
VRVAELAENILALEQSYNQIIQYINRNLLLERIEHLEKSYGRLHREILPINEESADIPATKAENEPQITLPALNLTPNSPLSLSPIGIIIAVWPPIGK